MKIDLRRNNIINLADSITNPASDKQTGKYSNSRFGIHIEEYC